MRSVLKRDTDLSSTLNNKNACVIDLEQGKMAGIRILVNRSHVTTWVEDSTTFDFREC